MSQSHSENGDTGNSGPVVILWRGCFPIMCVIGRLLKAGEQLVKNIDVEFQ